MAFLRAMFISDFREGWASCPCMPTNDFNRGTLSDQLSMTNPFPLSHIPLSLYQVVGIASPAKKVPQPAVCEDILGFCLVVYLVLY